MKKIRKLIAFVSMLSIFALFSVTAMAEERPENKEQSIEITFSDEYGDEITVPEEMVDELLKVCNFDDNVSYDAVQRSSCTHIPCNHVTGTVTAHVKVSSTECWVYSMKAIICKCCGAPLEALSSWTFQYSHAAH